MKKKLSRLEAIRHLVSTRALHSQTELAELLKNSFHIDAHQSLISRDLRTLGIVKVVEQGKSVYRLSASNPEQEILKKAIVSINQNNSMIVVETMAGLAPFVADQIDLIRDQIGVLGTLGGENTIFVVPQKINNIQAVCQSLHTLLKQGS